MKSGHPHMHFTIQVLFLSLGLCATAFAAARAPAKEVSASDSTRLLVGHLQWVPDEYKLESLRIIFEANSGTFSSHELPWRVFAVDISSEGKLDALELASGSLLLSADQILEREDLWIEMPDSREIWSQVLLDPPLRIGREAMLLVVETTADGMLGGDHPGYEKFEWKTNSYLSTDEGGTWEPLTATRLLELAGYFGAGGSINLELQNRGRP